MIRKYMEMRMVFDLGDRGIGMELKIKYTASPLKIRLLEIRVQSLKAKKSEPIQKTWIFWELYT